MFRPDPDGSFRFQKGDTSQQGRVQPSLEVRKVPKEVGSHSCKEVTRGLSLLAGRRGTRTGPDSLSDGEFPV